MFQSTRPRGARLINPRLRCGGVIVSIHAPARGATTDIPPYAPSSPSFNPRAREGRDAMARPHGRLRIVSIHAPARGATRVDN